MRPNWPEIWMDVAEVIARRSHCSRAKVGAVIVSKDERIIATGYNGPPRDWQYSQPGHPATPLHVVGDCVDWCERRQEGPTPATVDSYSDCPSIHAEMNALMHSSREDREGGTLYVTSAICFTCAKAVANSGLAGVWVMSESARSYRLPRRSYEFMSASGLFVYELAPRES